MPGFLIPLAGLALGALGNLVRNRRAQQALGNAITLSGTSMPSETGLSTAATSGDASPTIGAAQTSGGNRVSDQDRGVGPGSKGGPDVPPVTPPGTPPGTPPVTQPATGPVQQNRGTDSPTPRIGQDETLAMRLGQESVQRSRRRNREQRAGVSNAALS